MRLDNFCLLIRAYDKIDKEIDLRQTIGIQCDSFDAIPDFIITLIAREFGVSSDIIADFLMQDSVFSSRKTRFPYINEYLEIDVKNPEEAYNAFCRLGDEQPHPLL